MATMTIDELAASLKPGQPPWPRPRHQDHRALRFRSGPSARDAAPGAEANGILGLDAEALLAFAGKEKIAAFVIGLPVNMDGSAGPRVQATRAFVRSMGEKTDIPFLWDERLSTVAAERTLIEMDVSRKKRAERIDSAAASFILQGALDRLSALGHRLPPSTTAEGAPSTSR